MLRERRSFAVEDLRSTRTCWRAQGRQGTPQRSFLSRRRTPIWTLGASWFAWVAAGSRCRWKRFRIRITWIRRENP